MKGHVGKVTLRRLGGFHVVAVFRGILFTDGFFGVKTILFYLANYYNCPSI